MKPQPIASCVTSLVCKKISSESRNKNGDKNEIKTKIIKELCATFYRYMEKHTENENFLRKHKLLVLTQEK